MEKTEQARALFFTAPFKVALRQQPLRRNPGEVLVTSRIIGISHGTERHLFEGTFNRGPSPDGLESLDGEMEYPLRYGYMTAGENEARERVFSFFPHQDRFYAAPSSLITFPSSFNYDDILLYPSVETAFTIALDASPPVASRVLITGQGVIGLLVTEILSSGTGLHLAALEPDPFRRELSRKLGVECIDPGNASGAELEGLIRPLFGGSLADLVIDVSGTSGGLQQSIDSTTFGGTVIEASWHGSESVNVRLGGAFHRRRLRLISSQVSTIDPRRQAVWSLERRRAEVIRVLSRISPSKYITHRYPFGEAESAFMAISRKEPGLLQAVLIPD